MLFKKNLKKKPLSTSKKLIYFIFANCTCVELFTIWATIKSLSLAENLLLVPDFTPLVALIGAVVGEAIGFAVYAAKAAKENSVNGITYMAAAYKNFSDENGVG